MLENRIERSIFFLFCEGDVMMLKFNKVIKRKYNLGKGFFMIVDGKIFNKI